MGWAFCDGQSGTRDLRGCVRRMIDAGAGRDAGREVGTYQEDTVQEHHHDSRGSYDSSSRTAHADAVLNPYGQSSSGVKGARVSIETRTKNVSAVPFQKIADIDWRLIPAKPPKF